MRVALAVIVASIVVPLAVHATTAVEIAVGSAGTDAEGNAAISVTLSANGANVGGTQNDILFDNTILRLDASRCQLNPAISWERTECDAEEILLPCKNLTQMLRRCGSVPQPTGCPPDAGDNISRLRAIIAATVVLNINSIPDGVLYTCTFEVLDPERLPAALLSGNPIASSPLGAQFPAVAISGAVTAELLPTASPTATFTPTALPTETPTPSSTSTPTDTPTHTVTSTPTATATATPTASQTPTATPTEEAVTCAGDCNASLAVTVDEITLLVNVALGTRDAGDCPPGDRDGDQEITVDELVAALNNGLNGCPA